MHKSEVRQGFTLAEVLITLSIIGVVAALTIPTLISSTANQKFSAALKKNSSILSQALQMKSVDGGSVSTITAADDNALAAWFSTQLNTISNNGTGLLVLADGTRLQFDNTSPGVNTTGCDDTDTDGICDTKNN